MGCENVWIAPGERQWAKEETLSFKQGLNSNFLTAIQSREHVNGLTHDFYHYPARFSPLFARAAIELFTEPGDLVIDPFVGGGTTLVEAQRLGRLSLGLDINSLAILVTRVKTTLLSEHEIDQLREWFGKLPKKLNLRNEVERPLDWIAQGYQRNINSKNTWPIRKTLELALSHIDELEKKDQQDFARCVLLKSGQWALHRRKELPNTTDFRLRLMEFAEEMLTKITEYSKQVASFPNATSLRPTLLHRNAVGVESEDCFKLLPPPKLILTSPPYPGVHVLYHRWQINGRKETPAPYWIADREDGSGASFYNFGGRHQRGHSNYFLNAHDAFRSIANLADENTIVVQLVGFSKRSQQLPAYLKMMATAGFNEIDLSHDILSEDGRIWREVPNRKWYAYRPGTEDSSKEVVLFHCLTPS